MSRRSRAGSQQRKLSFIQQVHRELHESRPFGYFHLRRHTRRAFSRGMDVGWRTACGEDGRSSRGAGLLQSGVAWCSLGDVA